MEGDGAELWRLLVRSGRRVILGCGVFLGEDHRSEGGTGMGSGAGDEVGAMPLLLWSGNLGT